MRKSGWMIIMLAIAGAAVAQARAEDGDWQFKVTPYGWAPSIRGDLGIRDVHTELDVPFSDILENLDLGGMLSVEARRKRWGLLADGVYMKVSADAETPGPFFNTIDTTIEMGTADLALAYRVVEGRRGWLDLLVGARYVYISGDLEMNPDYEAVAEISSTVMDQVVNTVLGQVEASLDGKSGELAEQLAAVTEDLGDAARTKVREEVQIRIDATAERIEQRIDEIMDKVEAIPPRKLDELKDKIQEKLDGITDAQRDALAEAVKEQINSRADEIKGNAAAIRQELRSAAEKRISDLKRSASARVAKALEKAEQELAKVIEEGMKAAAAADVSESKEWVDPYVGVRGRLNLTERTFVGTRADIGGFGVGSDLMWQVFGGVGVQVTRRVEVEAGWRHLAIDYDKDSFLMDVAFSGAAIGAGIAF